MGFSGFDDLMCDEHDLAAGWYNRARHLPPASHDLIVPYQFRPDRRPTRPVIQPPDGLIQEARDELREGRAIWFNLPVFHLDREIAKCRLLCRGRRHHKPQCDIQRLVQTLVQEFIAEMEQRSRVKLALIKGGPIPYPITYDDGDGVRRPEVRFMLAPLETGIQRDDSLGAPAPESRTRQRGDGNV